ncbi:MAG: 1-acyl-sn-glycerol-3-phosphate acyltransferase [Bacteroidota bacterium]
MTESKGPFPHVYPNIEDWGIHQLHADRSNFIKEIDREVIQRYQHKSNEDIRNIIAKTIYNERIRIKEEPWKVDPPNDKQFWKKISKRLILDKDDDETKQSNLELLQKIINRYSEEIVASFNPKTFEFARKFLRVFFGRLLKSASGRNFGRILGSKKELIDKLKIYGAVEQVRALSQKGTVIFVPTHFSNLDSILIGYIMDQIAGIQFPTFGAGLNLYNTGYTAYFINRLGAYRIDRRKKNPIYLETLKAYSMLALQRGTSSIFFPGGTRSRSGAMENKLKMGMLGTAIEAQRANYQAGREDKIFVVPVILGYHFVLEGKFLIEQHLRKTGKEMYFKSSRDQSYSFRKVMKFIWDTFSESSSINLTIGKPMDVLGNFVDDNGFSYDDNEKQVELKEFFYTKGKVVKNQQREMVYTRRLGERIVERFYADNLLLSSHLVAYVAFQMLLAQNPSLDIYGILRLPPEDYIFPMDAMKAAIAQMRTVLFEMQKNGEIKLSRIINLEIEDLIKDGINQLGTYHAEQPLKFNKKGQIISEDFNVLFFYANRLENYGFDTAIPWKNFELEEVTG